MQVFFSKADPVAEAEILVQALRAWLDEQKTEHEPRPGKAIFKYGAEGLRTINVVLDEPKAGV